MTLTSFYYRKADTTTHAGYHDASEGSGYKRIYGPVSQKPVGFRRFRLLLYGYCRAGDSVSGCGDGAFDRSRGLSRASSHTPDSSAPGSPAGIGHVSAALEGGRGDRDPCPRRSGGDPGCGHGQAVFPSFLACAPAGLRRGCQVPASILSAASRQPDHRGGAGKSSGRQLDHEAVLSGKEYRLCDRL